MLLPQKAPLTGVALFVGWRQGDACYVTDFTADGRDGGGR